MFIEIKQPLFDTNRLPENPLGSLRTLVAGAYSELRTDQAANRALEDLDKFFPGS